MKSRIVIALVGFAAGYMSHLTFSGFRSEPTFDVARHWEYVDRYLAYMRDPQNVTTDARGWGSVTAPYDLRPSLAVLVAANELIYVDLVLPTVPNNRAAFVHWAEFVHARSSTIVFAAANPQYVDYKPTGDVPLHLQLWFKESAKADVQRLIAELESLPEGSG